MMGQVCGWGGRGAGADVNLLLPLVEGLGRKDPGPLRLSSQQLAALGLPLSKGGASVGRAIRGSSRNMAALKEGNKITSLGIRV